MSRRPPLDDDDELFDDDDELFDDYSLEEWDLLKEEFPDFEGLDDLDWLEDHLDEEDDWYEE